MNLGQMVIVILGVVLFSTIVLGIYNNMMNQLEITGDRKYYSQGIRIADYVFQSMEVQMLNKTMNISSIFLQYQQPGAYMYGGTGTAPPITVDGVPYHVNVLAQYCDVNGNSSGGLITDWIRVFCMIEVDINGRKPYFVGVDEDDAFVQIFTNMP